MQRKSSRPKSMQRKSFRPQSIINLYLWRSSPSFLELKREAHFRGGSLWPQNPAEKVLPTLFKQLWNFKFWIFAFFFFFVFINMKPYGSKSFRWHLNWKYPPDLLPKIHVYSWGGSLPKLLTKLRNLNLWIFGNFFFFFFRPINMIVNG